MNPIKKISIYFLVMTALTLPLDQWTKAFSRSQLMLHESASDNTIYQGLRQELLTVGHQDNWASANLTYVRNHGASWGLFHDLNSSFRVAFLLIVGISFGLALMWAAVISLKKSQTRRAYLLAALVSGSLGNVLDRLRLGYVEDFITVKGRVGGYAWGLPSFNIADIIVVLSLFLLLIDFLKEDQKSGVGKNP